jgi:signal transduction histidine kinase
MARSIGSEAFGSRLLPALLAAWGIALVFAWWVGRDLVRPLRNLAAQLPMVDAPSLPDLPEAGRRDEIGDVARALRATHAALQGERTRRERAEQLAALGRMAAALAHEIQNPVAAIKLHAQLLNGTDHGETAAMLEHEATRIEDLLNQWLFLARPAPPAMRDIDLRDILDRCVAQQGAACRHAQVTTAVELDAPLLVRADARRLEQVFCNLLRNAIQAMPSGGALAIRGVESGGTVQVVVEDQGPGFSTEALRRYGELFYSEKEGGMGIGLAVAASVVAAHGGSLRPENRQAGGAAVHVTLPSIAAESSESRR